MTGDSDKNLRIPDVPQHTPYSTTAKIRRLEPSTTQTITVKYQFLGD